MRRIRLIIEYDGINYVGWQTQPNGVAIQEKIEQAILHITGQHVALHGSGRTDSGVHARAQVAHFDTDARMDAGKFAVALNTRLPSDIRILFSEECASDFHARFSAKEKQYRYTLQIGEHARVETRNTALHLHSAPDFAKMQRAAQSIIGTHDFAAFMAAGSKVENTTRSIYASEWTQIDNYWYYNVRGSGFLYNMVRILVGTMLDIGRGYLPENAMETALATRNRNNAGATAPAHGLCLMRVVYDSEE
ncbi:MAG: tRNA pseudouridine(38-40) synthase TruA [Clostridiales bacterium]|nr:tRNA pseudouridine(38-40) synthase TruA [Clostridiales bacterium]